MKNNKDQKADKARIRDLFRANYSRRSREWLSPLATNFAIVWKTIFYRAWISTLGLVVLAVVLSLAAAKDLLWNIYQSAAPLTNEPAHWSPYFAFWVSALVLALVLAAVAQLTGNLRFGAANEQRVEEAETDFIDWYSLYILFATLAVIHGAYCFEKSHEWSRMLVAWTSTAAFVAIARSFSRTGLFIIANFILVPAFLVVVFLIVALLFSEPELSISLFTPPVIGLLALRRDRPYRLPVNLSNRALTCIAAAIAAAAVLFYVLQSFSPFQRALWSTGSVAIFFVFLAWTAAFLGAVTMGIHRLFGGRRVDFALLIVVIAALFHGAHEKLGNESLAIAPAPSPTTEAVDPRKSTVATNADISPIPQFAIHADGGGLRAALFTAVVLSLADDMTCGDFGTHVFAASGVSGGSLGIATWAVLRQAYVGGSKKHPWIACSFTREIYEPFVISSLNFPLPLRVTDPSEPCAIPRLPSPVWSTRHWLAITCPVRLRAC